MEGSMSQLIGLEIDQIGGKGGREEGVVWLEIVDDGRAMIGDERSRGSPNTWLCFQIQARWDARRRERWPQREARLRFEVGDGKTRCSGQRGE
jgi:hypothetical protein